MKIKDEPKYHDRLRRCKEMRLWGYTIRQMSEVLNMRYKSLRGWLRDHREEYLKYPVHNIRVVRIE